MSKSKSAGAAAMVLLKIFPTSLLWYHYIPNENISIFSFLKKFNIDEEIVFPFNNYSHKTCILHRSNIPIDSSLKSHSHVHIYSKIFNNLLENRFLFIVTMFISCKKKFNNIPFFITTSYTIFFQIVR